MPSFNAHTLEKPIIDKKIFDEWHNALMALKDGGSLEDFALANDEIFSKTRSIATPVDPEAFPRAQITRANSLARQAGFSDLSNGEAMTFVETKLLFEPDPANCLFSNELLRQADANLATFVRFSVINSNEAHTYGQSIHNLIIFRRKVCEYAQRSAVNDPK